MTSASRIARQGFHDIEFHPTILRGVTAIARRRFTRYPRSAHKKSCHSGSRQPGSPAVPRARSPARGRRRGTGCRFSLSTPGHLCHRRPQIIAIAAGRKMRFNCICGVIARDGRSMALVRRVRKDLTPACWFYGRRPDRQKPPPATRISQPRMSGIRAGADALRRPFRRDGTHPRWWFGLLTTEPLTLRFHWIAMAPSARVRTPSATPALHTLRRFGLDQVAVAG